MWSSGRAPLIATHVWISSGSILVGGPGQLGGGGSIPSVSDVCQSPAGVVLTSHIVVAKPNVSCTVLRLMWMIPSLIQF